MRYRHLIQEERHQISALQWAGWSQAAIATKLERHLAGISRELNRNRVVGPYRPQVAGLLAAARSQKSAANARRVPTAAWQFAREKLAETWSPQQIAGHQRAEHLPLLSHKSIYQRIYKDKRAGGTLHLALRIHKQRRKRRGVRERRGTIPNQVSIDQHPGLVADRARYGDWEADLVIGARHSQALVTINERKSRYALITRVKSKQAAGVSRAIIEQLKPFSHMAHTLTTDNGKEFAQHERIAAELKLSYYFAHPHAAWERGANENLNGLLRQFFPKHREFEEVSDEEIALAQHRLNHRPRKCLGYKTRIRSSANSYTLTSPLRFVVESAHLKSSDCEAVYSGADRQPSPIPLPSFNNRVAMYCKRD
jgi:IS30 family transposase